jgi:hypothetical protein
VHHRPRAAHVLATQTDALQGLADIVMDEMELRISTLRALRGEHGGDRRL